MSYDHKEYEKYNKIAETILPCPFCGEKLVVHDDHHGCWIAHANLDHCIISHIQIFEGKEVERWNTRIQENKTEKHCIKYCTPLRADDCGSRNKNCPYPFGSEDFINAQEN